MSKRIDIEFKLRGLSLVPRETSRKRTGRLKRSPESREELREWARKFISDNEEDFEELAKR